VFLRKKKGEELTKGGTGHSSSGPLSSMSTRQPLPSGGTATWGLQDWDLFFLRWDRKSGALTDFFLRWDHDRWALQWDWNALFFWWDYDSGALQDWDLLFLRWDTQQ
jgi:hypothetical protein